MTRRISTLIGTNQLAEILSKPGNVRLLDGSWHQSSTKRNARLEFDKKHIRDAQFFCIKECSDKSSQYSYMLPNTEQFSKYVGKLGINNDTQIIVYDNNETFGMLSAPRVWWTFKVFGHHQVSILDGGMPKWKRDGYKVTDKVADVKPQIFKAKFNASMVKGFLDMQKNLEDKVFVVIDARQAGKFEGTSSEEKIKLGHMPNAVNIPYSLLLDPDTKTFRSPEEIKDVFKAKGIDLDQNQPITSTCGKGISACLLMLGAHICGREDVTVYDGSWEEWYQHAKMEHIIVS